MTASEAGVASTIVFGGLLIWFWMHRERKPRYRQRAFLTGCELEFFLLLKQALPEFMVVAQAPMSTLIEPVGVGPGRRAALAQIEGRRAAYAIFDREMQVQAVVNLDFRSRRSRTDAALDACFESAGIQVVRFQAKRLPSELEIRRHVCERQGRAARKRNSRRAAEDTIEFKPARTPWPNTAGIHS